MEATTSPVDTAQTQKQTTKDYKSPPHALIWFFRKSRDLWKLYFPLSAALSPSQAEQPFGDGPDFLLGDPRVQSRTNLLRQQLATPRPPLVRVARAAVRVVPRRRPIGPPTPPPTGPTPTPRSS